MGLIIAGVILTLVYRFIWKIFDDRKLLPGICHTLNITCLICVLPAMFAVALWTNDKLCQYFSIAYYVVWSVSAVVTCVDDMVHKSLAKPGLAIVMTVLLVLGPPTVLLSVFSQPLPHYEAAKETEPEILIVSDIKIRGVSEKFENRVYCYCDGELVLFPETMIEEIFGANYRPNDKMELDPPLEVRGRKRDDIILVRDKGLVSIEQEIENSGCFWVYKDD